MTVYISHASIDENGKASGGALGDSTGKEVCTRTWYNKPWIAVFRAKDTAIAWKIAIAAKAAADNNNIGYDQSNRTSLYTLAKAANWDLSKVGKCETDCSALVAVCCNAAGLAVSKDMYTGNEATCLMATGAFDKYTTANYISSSALLARGDILLAKGHTAIVTTGAITRTDTSGSGAATYTHEDFLNDSAAIWGYYDKTAMLSATVTVSATKNKNHAIVTPLERYLKSLGYYSGSIEADNGKTPIFGAGMTAAVMQYQKEVVGATTKNQDGELTARGATWKKLYA